MPVKTVEDFILQRVAPDLQPIVHKLRQMMRELAPATTEELTYGILGFRARRLIAVVSPTKKDITFAFSRGASFEDRYGLLQGVGHVSKNLKFKTRADVKKTILRYYVKQALEHDQR
jgi:hypothetical protein